MHISCQSHQISRMQTQNTEGQHEGKCMHLFKKKGTEEYKNENQDIQRVNNRKIRDITNKKYISQH